MTEKRTVNAILDMRRKGFSFNEIAEFLTTLGIPTKRKGQKWHKEVVRHIYALAQKDLDNVQFPENTNVTPPKQKSEDSRVGNS